MGGFFHNKHNLGAGWEGGWLASIIWGGGCQFLVDVKLALF